MVDAEEFETALAQLRREAGKVRGRDCIIPHRISGGIIRGKSVSDQTALPCQDSAAFSVRVAAGVRENLPVHLAAA